VAPKEKARLPKAIEHGAASLRKPKPGAGDRHRNNTVTGAPDADGPREPTSRESGGDDAEPIRLQPSNLRQGRNLFEHSNQHTLDGEAKGAADVGQGEEIEEDIAEAKKRPSAKASDTMSAD
jgi:hypothetical protein